VRLLLDTCTFLWIVADDPALSDKARQAFTDAANDVFFSAVSAWEIAIKHRLGKLPLPQPPEEFVPEYRSRHQISPLALEEEAALQLSRLPPHHRDPFDRMLICQAIHHGCAILSPDPDIRRYPVRTLW
jgi:PIN domain nuclease of toxin-antitoxin system